jgi:anti-sigma factor RsiW
MAHEAFEEALASYAIDALDPGEARTFEAHLSTCARCQSELAELRRVVAGIGLATEPMAPPASLKARTLSRALSREADGRRPLPRTQLMARPFAVPWLLAAASIVLALVSGMYAWSLRSRVASLEQMVSVTSAQADRLRDELISLRRESTNLIQTVGVISAPDVRQVILKGQPGAEGATGRAYFSPSRGLVFNADQLPTLSPGRVYQLWVIAGKTPVGVGIFNVTNGSGSLTVPLPAGLTTINAVAVTNEPGPNGSATPTLPILLIGQ